MSSTGGLMRDYLKDVWLGVDSSRKASEVGYRRFTLELGDTFYRVSVLAFGDVWVRVRVSNPIRVGN